jgi:hypothetical protein
VLSRGTRSCHSEERVCFLRSEESAFAFDVAPDFGPGIFAFNVAPASSSRHSFLISPQLYRTCPAVQYRLLILFFRMQVERRKKGAR